VILSIDVTDHPARAVAVKVEGRKVEILEERSAPLEGLFSPSQLLQLGDSSILNGNGQGADPQSSSGPLNTNTDAAPSLAINTFQELISSVQTPWTSAILIIPPYESHSLNVELPFGDPKNIDKILDL